MDSFQKLSRRGQLYLFIVLVAENALLAAVWLGVGRYVPARWQILALLGTEVVLIIISLVVAIYSVRWLLSPLRLLWQTILFLAPVPADTVPNPDKLKFGRELVISLTNQIYQLASSSKAAHPEPKAKLDFISSNLPLPLLVIDETDVIRFVNSTAATYLKKDTAEMVGKSVYDVLNMSFQSDETFEVWLKKSRSSAAVASKTWNQVRLNLSDGQSASQFDLAAYYNKDNSDHLETIMVLFDRTEAYSRGDDQADFVALAVHELRNPLTMLRGYIEVLEEEMPKDASVELINDLKKMRSSAQLLAEYTNNILNASRIDSDQLSLHLKSEDWKSLVSSVVELMRPRAKMRGIEIKLEVADGLPEVGVDHVSASEVLTNLIDNAIKYSSENQTVSVSVALNETGDVETRVKDFGVVIDPAIIGNLFQKFYRNHQSRAQVSGTGLGLYLSKALVEAHGGNIWITSSAEGGTVSGFTVLPYSKVTEGKELSNGEDITRVAHGWIKNHSLYRR